MSAPADRRETVTLAELIDEHVLTYAGRDRARGQRLSLWRERLGHRAAASLTEEDIEAVLTQLAAEPARVYHGIDADGRRVFLAKGRRSGGTINRYLASVAGLFSWAIRMRKLPRHFEHPCRRIARRPESRGVVRFLSEDERERLLAACREARWPRLYLLVLMALTTGARRGELLALTWADIDFERAEAYVRDTKNGEPRVLPLLPAVLAELGRWRSADARALVFRSRLRPTQPMQFETSWRAALSAAGIRRFRFHDLRHTCASYLAQEGASLLEIADVMGHRQLAMVKRYAHLTTKSKHALVRRVLGKIE